MTILFFTRRFYPHIGGVEKHVMEVSKRLAKQGHTMIVVTEVPSKDQLYTQSDELPTEIDGIKIIRVPSGSNERRKKFIIWKWLFTHRSLIKSADVVHCHDVFFWYLPFRFLYPGKKVYTTFHGYEGEEEVSKKAYVMHKIGEKLSCGNMCVGAFLKKWYGTHPTLVTYGATDTSRIVKIKMYRELHILLIGRLSKDNTIHMYTNTLKYLVDRNIPFTFTACGDGEYRHELEEYGEVVGFTDQLLPFIQKADIIFTSSYLSILEALSQKKNVFAVYDNLLKKDYLEMTPFKRFISIKSNHIALTQEILDYAKNRNKKFQESKEEGFLWAKKQTWKHLVELYLLLWNT